MTMPILLLMQSRRLAAYLELKSIRIEKTRQIHRASERVRAEIDIDAPHIEAALLAQIVADAELSSRIDELYFEHHVHRSPMAALGWRRMLAGSNETLPDSYGLFSRLRALGIRAHSWV